MRWRDVTCSSRLKISFIIIANLQIFADKLCKNLGHAIAQLVEALYYKPEGRGFGSPWCYWNFSLTLSLPPHYGPGVDSASKRNEYQKYFLGVKVAGA